MAAVALAISGGGALSSFETTVLLTVEETMEALRRPSRSSTGLPAPNGRCAQRHCARADGT